MDTEKSILMQAEDLAEETLKDYQESYKGTAWREPLVALVADRLNEERPELLTVENLQDIWDYLPGAESNLRAIILKFGVDELRSLELPLADLLSLLYPNTKEQAIAEASEMLGMDEEE